METRTGPIHTVSGNVDFMEATGQSMGTNVHAFGSNPVHKVIAEPYHVENSGGSGTPQTSIRERKTERTLATLSAIAVAVASVLFIIPAAVSLGGGVLGAAGMGLGLIGGPAGALIGGWTGAAVGMFAGFSISVYFTPYLVAKAYNLVLEAQNGNNFERSNLADRIVSHYEGKTHSARGTIQHV